MAENSKIEWTDHTFNPWVGCSKVHEGCTHCYAESFAKRYGKATTVRAFDGKPNDLTEMDALVAYLQILGRLTDAAHKPVTTAEKKP